MQIFIILTIFCLTFVVTKQKNNVCKKLNDYWFRRDENCYYNPDQDSEAWDIIERHGYKYMNYTITTQDGYNLLTFRIPSNNHSAPPVLLVHGIYMSSMPFIDAGNDSLAFQLANKGYDVWLINLRGTRYSNTHKTLSNTDAKYWDFSYYEMGKYDVDSVLDLIWNETNRKAFYIGFSMGTTVSYVYAIEHSEKAHDRLKVVYSLAPIAYLKKTKSSIVHLNRLLPLLEPVGRHVGYIFGRSPQSTALFKKVCLKTPIQIEFCLTIMQSIFGFDWAEVNWETYPVTALQNPDAIAIKVLKHYKQAIKYDDFLYFDYGKTKNMELYGSQKPPQFNLSKINVPIMLIHGKNDYVATPPNVERLYKNLPNNKLPKYEIPYAKFQHSDFVSAKHVKTLLYDFILADLAKY